LLAKVWVRLYPNLNLKARAFAFVIILTIYFEKANPLNPLFRSKNPRIGPFAEPIGRPESGNIA
jgi:hypothetical protein